MAKQSREINVFSTSAIDLFASSLGVFIILVIVIMPYYGNKSKDETPMITDVQQEEQKKEILTLKEKLDQVTRELSSKSEDATKSIEQKEQIEKTKVLLSKSEQETKKVKEQLEAVRKQLNSKNKSETKKISELTNSIKVEKKLNSKIAQLEKELKKVKKSTPPPVNTTKLKREITQKQTTINQITQQVQQQSQQIQKQSQQIQQLKKQEESFKNTGSFAAIVIQWESNKHDIDLTVRDARGKKFNFKKRQHSGHPGKFSLDSRTGPGAELWQSSKLIPGNYEITYQFYNSYGNSEPAIVKGTIFTRKGSIKLPKATLDFSKKKLAKFKAAIDEDGKVKVTKIQ